MYDGPYVYIGQEHLFVRSMDGVYVRTGNFPLGCQIILINTPGEPQDFIELLTKFVKNPIFLGEEQMEFELDADPQFIPPVCSWRMFNYSAEAIYYVY